MFKRQPQISNQYYDDYFDDKSEMADGTKIVAKFYEEEPFPNYDEIISRHQMVQKAEQGQYSRAISELCPEGGTLLEVGCGTGQLTNYIGLTPERTVIGLDLSRASLKLAGDFRNKVAIKNTRFIRADLYDHPFQEGGFDVVVANGVLHHTVDTWKSLEVIEGLLKPGGIAVIGLYNVFGRWRTNLLRKFSGFLGHPLLTLLDPITTRKLNAKTKKSWINDQYFHPLERSHTYEECIEHQDRSNLEIIRLIPDPLNFYAPEPKLDLSEKRPLGSFIDRVSTQVTQGVIDNADGGLFSVIYRKEDNEKNRE